MLDFVQQLVSGIALGCVYGLIALGFVLIYKATEVVNFAQGDLMMLGGFFGFTFIAMLGFNYWIGFALAVAYLGESIGPVFVLAAGMIFAGVFLVTRKFIPSET